MLNEQTILQALVRAADWWTKNNDSPKSAIGHFMRVADEANQFLAERAAAAAPVVASGWKLVPIEPTEGMIYEGGPGRRDQMVDAADVWACMLAAAPASPAAPVAPADEQSRKCELRLCCRADAHADGCNTYDPARYRDEFDDAAPVAQPADERALYEAWELREAERRKGEPLTPEEVQYVLKRWPRDTDTYNYCPQHWPAFQAGMRAAATPAAPLAQQSEPVATVYDKFGEKYISEDYAALQELADGTRLYAGSAPASPVPATEQQAQAELDAQLREEVVIMYQALDDGEWAEHIAATPHGQCLETAITRLVGKAAPASTGPAPEGNWLWAELMDWCKKRKVSPANYDDLFAIVKKARASTETSQRDNPCSDDTAKDAARWRETIKHIGGTYTDVGAQRFTLRYLSPVEGADIMKGSVAYHFIDAIDHAIEGRAALSAAEQGGKA